MLPKEKLWFITSGLCFVTLYYLIANISSQVYFDFTEQIKDAEILTPNDAFHIYIPAEANETISAWIFPPTDTKLNNSKAAPAVILSHGLGGQKDMGFGKFITPFRNMGFVVVDFDYRTFGGSENDWRIRNLIDPWKQVEDVITVINYTASLPCVDKNKIVLFGASFGGGHSIVAAAKLGHTIINSVIVITPYLDGVSTSIEAIKRQGHIKSITLGILSIIDYIRSFLKLSPLYIRIYGKENELAFMNMFDEEYNSFTPKTEQVNYFFHTFFL
jgi:pimeloyl-ACP methyl ester carboxylesterase